jgi:hypothetical protein
MLRTIHRRIYLWVAALWLTAPGLGLCRESDQFQQLLDSATQNVRYEPVSRTEMVAATRLFSQTLQHDTPPDTVIVAWKQLGWELRPFSMNRDKCWVLMEDSTDRRGRGVFVFRPQGGPVILQAPHSFFDQHTESITRDLFRWSNFRAAAWNSVHRKTEDAAHTEQHYFNALTIAAAELAPSPFVVQIHGFSQSHRKTPAGKRADIIASNGSKVPAPWFQRASLHLHGISYGTVLMYPHEIRELGATTNAQAAALRAAGSDRFLHLELSQPLRERLRTSESLQRQMVNDLEIVCQLGSGFHQKP